MQTFNWNITLGTREATSQIQSSGSPSSKRFWSYFKYICWCCVPPHLRQNAGNTDVMEVISDDSIKQDETNSGDPQRVGEGS